MDVFFVQRDEPSVERRTVPIKLVSGADYLTPWTGTLVGDPKAYLSVYGEATQTSDNAYQMPDNTPGIALLTLSAAEIAECGDIVVTIMNGGAFGQTLVRVVEYDPISEGASSSLAIQHRAGKPS